MKLCHANVWIFSLIILSGCTSVKDSALQEELRGIRTSLDLMAKDIAEIKKAQSAQTLAARRATLNMPMDSKGADREALAKITLPDNPSPEQVTQYISDIVVASRGQNSFSSEDPQIAMLVKIGRENISLLIANIDVSSSWSRSYYLVEVVERFADESNKTLIFDALPTKKELVKVVVKKGWELEARDILVQGLKDGGYLSTEWINAVATLHDEESYPLLRNYFINGNNRPWTYKAIQNLPIKDLSGAVAQAWEKCLYAHSSERNSMAVIAAEYGHLDALAVVIDSLMLEKSNEYWLSQEARPALLRCMDFFGTDAEMFEWFNLNKKRLRFNSETKKFEVDATL